MTLNNYGAASQLATSAAACELCSSRDPAPIPIIISCPQAAPDTVAWDSDIPFRVYLRCLVPVESDHRFVGLYEIHEQLDCSGVFQVVDHEQESLHK